MAFLLQESLCIFNTFAALKQTIMKLEDLIQQRAGNTCELCHATQNLQLFEIPPQDQRNEENCVLLCETCRNQIEKKAEPNASHWTCLTEAMWSEQPGIQVLSWRLLNRFRNESWASDQLDMMYLDDERLAWAKATGDHENDGSVQLHRDSNGHQLLNGDSVVLIKSLDVKGSTLNARMGTVVRNIRIVPDNVEQIEGRVEGQLIVILTKYVRKQQAGLGDK